MVLLSVSADLAQVRFVSTLKGIPTTWLGKVSGRRATDGGSSPHDPTLPPGSSPAFPLDCQVTGDLYLGSVRVLPLLGEQP